MREPFTGHENIGPGFQGSDKSGVELTIYAHGDDPVFNVNGVRGAIKFLGPATDHHDRAQNEFVEASASAISKVVWTKALGGASGRFSIDIKTHRPEIFEQGLHDDDWLDLVFTQHGRKYHVCTGIIDTIRESNHIDNGATDRTFTITGRDHGKIFEETPVFFNRFIGENVGGGATLRAFVNSSQGAQSFGAVDTTTNAFLFEFLRQLGAGSNARWELPPGMPGLTINSSTGQPIAGRVFFNDVVRFQASGFTNFPSRTAYRPWFQNPEGFVGYKLWHLAQEWSDPAFCELYTDLVRSDTGLPPGPGEELRPENSLMGVILRDKPFPTGAGLVPITQSPWFSIPMHLVTQQELTTNDVGRGGEERFNAFFVRCAAMAEFSSQNVDITKPLWFPDDVAKRGIRRMDITSNYVSSTADNLGLVDVQRRFLRDWYGLNAYYRNGSLPLGHLRPDIRIASRVRVPGADPLLDQTFYVEGLTHNWSLGKGRTYLTVTRGWKGSDQSLIRAVNALAARYEVPGSFVLDDAVRELGGQLA